MVRALQNEIVPEIYYLLDDEAFSVLAEVGDEMERQNKKWGTQNHGPTDWVAIETEELGEAAQAANKAYWTVRNKLGLDGSRSILQHLWNTYLKIPPAVRPDFSAADKHLDNFEEEMVQVAAVAVQAVISIRRQRKQGAL